MDYQAIGCMLLAIVVTFYLMRCITTLVKTKREGRKREMQRLQKQPFQDSSPDRFG